MRRDNTYLQPRPTVLDRIGCTSMQSVIGALLPFSGLQNLSFLCPSKSTIRGALKIPFFKIVKVDRCREQCAAGAGAPNSPHALDSQSFSVLIFYKFITTQFRATSFTPT